MFDLNKRKVLIYDYGTFTFLAERLAEDFGEVIYFTPWKSALPRAEKAVIGEGLEGITNCREFYEALKELDPKRDIVAFFHVGEGDLQENLRKQGYTVFGMGGAEVLEMNRYQFKQELKKMGLPIIPYEHIKGIDDLDEYLRGVENKHVKISSFRWLTETWKHINYAHSKARLRKLAYNAGAFQSKIEFVVEDHIEGEEGGTDNFISDGEYFDKCLFGFELKDAGYVCKVSELSDVPKPFLDVLLKAQPFFKEKKSRGMFSTEVRITKDMTPYWNDATIRGGLPPSEIICEQWKNFSEAVWATANGETIKLEPVAKYAAQVILCSSWAKTEATVIEFPKKIAKSIKLYNACKMDGYFKYIPQDNSDVIASAIGLSDDLEEAEVIALKAAGQVKADSLDYDGDCFDMLDEKLEKAKKLGIKF